MQYLCYRVSNTHRQQSIISFLGTKQKQSKNPKNFNPIILLSLILLIFALKPFIEFDDNGIAQLAEWRKEKLNKELNNFDEAEQYALIAKTDGSFPCFNCRDDPVIKLKKGEVWKYGYTTKGKSGRYPKLEGKNLIYVIQFTGNIQECLKEERRKIYYYAILPENLKREKPLIRPPGNKQDS